MNQKQLWEDLAKKNSKYYINSDKGKGITEEEFRMSGACDFNKYIINDKSIVRSGVFLEIGCGNGRMTEFIAHSFDTVVGIDISGEMIRQAKERVGSIGNVEFMETDGNVIPLPDNFVDVAFSYLVFQHFKTKEMVENNFHEVRRVLLPEGVFKVLLRTDKIDSLDPWWSGVNYDKKEIVQLCEKTKLHLDGMEFVGDYGVWVWMRKLI